MDRSAMFSQFVEENRAEMILTLQQLLQIDSVKSLAEPGCPFGRGPSNALAYMLEMAAKYGFVTQDIDGYAGHVEYGSGDEYIAVLSHLDVVPAGVGWTYPPFSAEIHNGKVFARGAIDDKGPAMSTLWSLIALKQLGIVPKRKIRLIFGLDEESDWQCMEYYFRHEPQPLGGFTPDADFPLIYAEKGLATFRIVVPSEVDVMSPKVIHFQGGTRVNMVPECASAVIECHSEIAALEWEQGMIKDAKHAQMSVDIHAVGSCVQIVVHGISAHASHPNEGVNAIVQLAQLLCSRSMSEGIMWRVIAGMDTAGHGLGIACSDQITGELTANFGKVDLLQNAYYFYVNIRYPIDTNAQQLLARCKAYVSDKWSIELVEDLAPLYVPADSPVVQILQRVYTETTGKSADLLTIGGATYARAIRNGVAFGALHPGELELAHQKDEHWSLNNYFEAIQIYAQAMMELANTL